MVKRENKPDKALKLTFPSRVIFFGGNRRAISIPARYLEDVNPYVGEDIIVTIKTIPKED